MVQIKVALAAIRNIRGLPSAQDVQKHGRVRDLFDFLQYWFGFQVIYSQVLALLPFVILLYCIAWHQITYEVGKLEIHYVVLYFLICLLSDNEYYLDFFTVSQSER
jgi:hypothetical protein